MSDRKPFYVHTDPVTGDLDCLAEFQDGDVVPVSHGGTGVSEAADALAALGGVGAAQLQNHIDDVTKHPDISALAPKSLVDANAALIVAQETRIDSIVDLFNVADATLNSHIGDTVLHPDVGGIALNTASIAAVQTTATSNEAQLNSLGGRGLANGYPYLGADQLIPSSFLPVRPDAQVFIIASDTELPGLTPVFPGDEAINTTDNTQYVYGNDATWHIRPSSAESVMQGATPAAAGAQGLVPQPSAGEDMYVLTGNGAWTQPRGLVTEYTQGKPYLAGAVMLAAEPDPDETSFGRMYLWAAKIDLPAQVPATFTAAQRSDWDRLSNSNRVTNEELKVVTSEGATVLERTNQDSYILVGDSSGHLKITWFPSTDTERYMEVMVVNVSDFDWTLEFVNSKNMDDLVAGVDASPLHTVEPGSHTYIYFRKDVNEGFYDISNPSVPHVLLSDKGIADGVAELDASAKVPIVQLPKEALSVAYALPDYATLLTVSTMTPGDMAVLDSDGSGWVYDDNSVWRRLGNVYGRFAINQMDSSDQTTKQPTSSAPVALDFDVNIPELGVYELTVSYGWNFDNVSSDFIGWVEHNGSQIGHKHQQEPKDTSGSGLGGSNQVYYISRKFYISLSPGLENFKLRYAVSNTDYSAAITDISMSVIRFN